MGSAGCATPLGSMATSFFQVTGSESVIENCALDTKRVLKGLTTAT